MFAIYTEVKKTLLAVHTMLSNRPLPFPAYRWCQHRRRRCNRGTHRERAGEGLKQLLQLVLERRDSLCVHSRAVAVTVAQLQHVARWRRLPPLRTNRSRIIARPLLSLRDASGFTWKHMHICGFLDKLICISTCYTRANDRSSRGWSHSTTTTPPTSCPRMALSPHSKDMTTYHLLLRKVRSWSSSSTAMALSSGPYLVGKKLEFF
jgi:hypothetical protein